VIVIDSVAALVLKAELEGDMVDSHMGLQDRLMSQALRKLTPVVHKSKTVLIFINQIRHNIGAMPFANKETTTGGNALKFYASVRLDVRRIASLKKNDVNIGNRIRVRVVKNKVAPPFKQVEVDLLFSEGISKELDLLDAALHLVMIAQTGKAGVPVVKIMDVGKVIYEKKKKSIEAKKHQKIIQVKEVKMSPKIGEHDFQTKIKQAVQFLTSGKRVKITLSFRGREMATKDMRGTELFNKIQKSFEDHGLINNLVQEQDAKIGKMWSRVYYLK